MAPWASLSAAPRKGRQAAVRGRLAVPSVCIAAEPRRVGAPLVGALNSAMPTGRAGTTHRPKALGHRASLPLRRDRVAQGVGGRLAAPWFRNHDAEHRAGQARHLVIAFTRSNGASHKNHRGWTRHSSLATALLNSSWELTAGSSGNERPTVMRALTVTRFIAALRAVVPLTVLPRHGQPYATLCRASPGASSLE